MAMIQADVLMSYQAVNNESDIICSTVTDFPAIIGPDCLILQDMKFNQGAGKKRGTVEAMT
eukprot:4395613-Ditylum_brightwellii.AAC.1